MAGDLLALMWVPFLMCLVLTGIHAYLGFHVIAREVVFVDIALAQIAALGATAAFLFGFDLEAWASYCFALAFTLLGALVLALTRSRERHVSQEAVIGVVYAVSSAAAVLLADRAPARRRAPAQHARRQHPERERQPRSLKVAVLYAAIGLFHWAAAAPFFLISTDPDARVPRGLARARVGLPVLRLLRRRRDQLGADRRRAPRLLVPDRARARRDPRWAAASLTRLLIGWAFGTLVSVLAMLASASLDLPTGATVVCAFGLTLLVLGDHRHAHGPARRI